MAGLEALLERFYQAAAEPDRLPDAVGGVLPLVGGDSVAFRTIGAGHHAAIVRGLGGAGAQDYPLAGLPGDVILDNIRHGVVGRVVTDRDLMPEAAFLRSPFYQDWAAPQGIFTAMSSVIDRQDGRSTALTVRRGRTRAPFSQADRHLFRRICTHLRFAHLAAGLAAERRAGGVMAGAALERAPDPMVLADRQGRVRHASAAVRALTLEVDGLLLTDDGLLVAAAPGGPGCLWRFAPVVACVLDVQAEKVVRVARGEAVPLLIELVPLAAEQAALLRLRNVAPQRRWADEALMTIWSLTRAECAVALSIARGADLRQTAERLGVGVNTVRAHLRAILEKTRTHRQAELASLINGVLS
jgi:DNA-binding CsgD family transcriptional regulator